MAHRPGYAEGVYFNCWFTCSPFVQSSVPPSVLGGLDVPVEGNIGDLKQQPCRADICFVLGKCETLSPLMCASADPLVTVRILELSVQFTRQ